MHGATVWIVVVNYGSSDLVADNLRSLGRDIPVVIADNFSSAGERSKIRHLAQHHGWALVSLSENRGFGAGVNAAALRAFAGGAKAIVLLNPDAVIDRQVFEQLAADVLADPFALVSPRIVSSSGANYFSGATVNMANGRTASTSPAEFAGLVAGSSNNRHTVPWLTGAVLAISKAMFETLDGLDESFFLYWEDVDLSYRALRAGGRLVVRDELVAIHDEGGTQVRRPGFSKSPTYFRYSCQNRLVFARKHLSNRDIMRWMISTPSASWNILKQGGRRQILRSPVLLWAALRGSVTGLGAAAGGTIRHRSATARTEPSPLRLLVSYPNTRPQGAPYRILLEESLRQHSDLEIKHFTWRTALFGRYDAFHIHWPEALIGGRTPSRRFGYQLAYLLLLIRLRLCRTPIVRTRHNLKLPSGLPTLSLQLLHLTERWTTLWISINEGTSFDPSQAHVTIVHGHYRNWFGDYRLPSPIDGRLLFFGLVRGYKGVDALIEQFRTLDRTLGVTLRVVGKPSSEALADRLKAASTGDSRITLTLELVDDRTLVHEIGEAELIVLPYKEMHNSAGLLTALSLNRPVLVPDNKVNRDLASEVGPGWVYFYEGALSGADLERALRQVRERSDVESPDLSRRGWESAGTLHIAAYRRAWRIRRGLDAETYPIRGAM